MMPPQRLRSVLAPVGVKPERWGQRGALQQHPREEVTTPRLGARQRVRLEADARSPDQPAAGSRWPEAVAEPQCSRPAVAEERSAEALVQRQLPPPESPAKELMGRVGRRSPEPLPPDAPER